MHKDWPELDVEPLLAGPIDAGADNVRGDQVGSELNPGEFTANDGGEAAYRQRLCDARHAFEQTMALGKQGNHQLLDHVFLPDDDALNLGDGVAEELRGGLISGLARRPSGGALLDGLAK